MLNPASGDEVMAHYLEIVYLASLNWLIRARLWLRHTGRWAKAVYRQRLRPRAAAILARFQRSRVVAPTVVLAPPAIPAPEWEQLQALKDRATVTEDNLVLAVAHLEQNQVPYGSAIVVALLQMFIPDATERRRRVQKARETIRVDHTVQATIEPPPDTDGQVLLLQRLEGIEPRAIFPTEQQPPFVEGPHIFDVSDVKKA